MSPDRWESVPTVAWLRQRDARATGPLSGSRPLYRFCGLALSLTGKLPEGQSYPSEGQT